MRCFMCGAMMPDSVSFCTECGAKLSKSMPITDSSFRPEPIPWLSGGSEVTEKERKAKKRRAAQPLTKVFTCRLIAVIISGVSLVLAGYLVSVLMKYLSPYNTGSFASLRSALSLTRVASIVLGIISLILGVILLITYHELEYYEERFKNVLICALVMIVIAIIGGIFGEGAVYQIFSGLAQLVYMVCLYGALQSLTEEDLPSLSNKWSLMGKGVILICLFKTVAETLVAIAKNGDSVEGYMNAYKVELAAYVVAFVFSIIEIVLLKKTADAIGGVGYEVSLVDHRSDEY
ncbi:MAG: zinc ribbon domain-containing protein [Lachnospiraceae bacterium]|nr:zinc ribbon domain-containing protein [Lachnospiraceae bacterium]